MSTTATTPNPTAPEALTADWIAVANQVGTLRVAWINNSGGTNPSYQRIDLRIRDAKAPATVFTLRTWQPFTGARTADVTAVANGWPARTDREWEVEVRASIAGRYASTGWTKVAPLVTPKPSITSVARTSETDAWVYFTAPTSGLARPTAAHVARSTAGSDVGSSTNLNNVAMPASRVRLPIPPGTTAFRAWLRYLSPAGWSAPDVAVVPQWWKTPPQVTNLAATRNASNRAQVDMSWGHAGTGGESAQSFLLEFSDDGQVWRTVTTVTGKAHKVTLDMRQGRTFGVTAVNKAGNSSRATVKVEPWWQPVPGASNLVSSHTPQGQVKLEWALAGETDRAKVRSWTISRGPVSGGDMKPIKTGLPASARSWVDPASTELTTARYAVVAVGDVGPASTVPSVTVSPAVLAPDAPTSVVVTRDVDDPDAFRVAFEIRESADKRVDVVELVARDAQGSVSVVASARRADLGVSDSLRATMGPNRLVEFAVRARNAAGVSEPLVWSARQATTPKGAARLISERVGVDVVNRWTVDGPTTATGWELERSPDGGVTRFPIPSPTSDGSARSAVHASAAFGVGHTYWVRPVREGAPAGAWVRAEAPIPAGGQPDTPIALEPGWGEFGEPVVVSWEHRSVDGSPQAGASLRWEIVDRSDEVVDSGALFVAGVTSTATLPVTPRGAQTIRWQVATQGTGSPLWSPWSEWQPRRFANRPWVSLSVPSVVESQRLVGWFEAEAAWVSATVRLLDAEGHPLDVLTLTGGADVLTGGAGGAVRTEFSFLVRDRQAGSVSVVLHDGRLESAPRSAAFTVAWRRPPAPTLTATVDGERVRLDATVPAGLRIVRRRLDGEVAAWDEELAPQQTISTQRATLTAPDGTRRDALIVSRSPDTGAGGIEVAVKPARAGETVKAWATLTNTGGDTAMTGVPEWPETVTRELPIANGKARLRLDGRQSVAVMDLAVIGSSEDEPRWTWFDGDTLAAEGHTYGWGGDGIAWEAVEAASAAEVDVAFPPPARLEFVRVDDGKSLGEADDSGRGWDKWPRFCAPETYVARAWGDNGAWSDSPPVTVTVHQRDIVANFGPDLAGRVTAGPRSLSEEGGAVEKEVLRFVGRPPVEFAGSTPTLRTLTVSAKLWAEHSSPAEWLAAHNAPGPVLLRDPTGLVVLGSLSVGQRDLARQERQAVTFTVTETGARP